MLSEVDLLKFLCVIKKRKDGKFLHYHSLAGKYWRNEADFLAAHGFWSWQEVQAGSHNILEGFVACQMRPPSKVSASERGTTLYRDARYDAPYHQWRFSIRHQPAVCPIPDWVNIGEVRTECIRLLPYWAADHLLRDARRSCDHGMAVVGLGSSVIYQTAGHVWAYGSSIVYQSSGYNTTTFLHEDSTGFISGTVWAYDNSRVELEHTGHARIFGSGTLILRPGPDGALGTFCASDPAAKVYRVRPGVSATPTDKTPDGGLIRVSFEPQTDPLWHVFGQRQHEDCHGDSMLVPPDSRNCVNPPFGCAVD